MSEIPSDEDKCTDLVGSPCCSLLLQLLCVFSSVL